MRILENYDLKNLNTFGVSARARFFAELASEQELKELFSMPEFKNNRKLFLGGGSNILFTKDFDGIVVLNKLKGIAPTSKRVGVPTSPIVSSGNVGKNDVYIRAMSGEIWHDLVLFAVERELWGIENLSLIPGTVGAAPMQNIGAYGAELQDVLESVEGLEIETGARKVFRKEECDFGYRDSIFKNKLKDKYFISAITLKLKKNGKPNTSYKILQDHLEKNEIKVKGPKDISHSVAHIRRSKLPDPAVIPNAGSFFKNVFLSNEKFEELHTLYPDMPIFFEASQTKVPAAWFIEKCGPASGASWKGYRIGNAGVHEKQALVLVNHGRATGEEIKNLAEQIIASVYEKFGITLVPEVNLI